MRTKNGKYLGMFTTVEQFKKYKKNFIRRYQNFSGSLYQFVEQENLKLPVPLHYNTTVRWFREKDMSPIKARPKSTELRGIRLDPKIRDVLTDFKQHGYHHTILIEVALSLVFGLPSKYPILIIYFKTGTAIFVTSNTGIKCVLTGHFDSDLLATVKILTNNAKEHGLTWLRDYASRSGLAVYPPKQNIDALSP
jgi:hypothetical protein